MRELKGFGFDNYFIPEGIKLSLFELDNKGLKGNFSARYKALMNLKNDKVYLIKEMKLIPDWEGNYQE